jgi:hypothetical protein
MSRFRLLCTLQSSIKDSGLGWAAGAGVSFEIGHSMVERCLAEALLEIEIVVFLVPVLLSSDEEENRNFAELSRECPLAHALLHCLGVLYLAHHTEGESQEDHRTQHQDDRSIGV